MTLASNPDERARGEPLTNNSNEPSPSDSGSREGRWDPAQYDHFGDQRLRPALDLLARVPPIEARSIIDLGCGSGALLEALCSRFPGADLLALDASPEMVEQARKVARSSPLCSDRIIELRAQDLEHWLSETEDSQGVDLIFCNAVLHWVDGHEELFPRLVHRLRPGGVLAVQMPRNFDAPSHQLIRESLRELAHPGIPDLIEELRKSHLLTTGGYYDVLRTHCNAIDLWETEYSHQLATSSELPAGRETNDEVRSPVFEWTRGTALLPVYRVLEDAPEILARFEDRYDEALRAAYPVRLSGITLLPFRRLFVLATRAP